MRSDRPSGDADTTRTYEIVKISRGYRVCVAIYTTWTSTLPYIISSTDQQIISTVGDQVRLPAAECFEHTFFFGDQSKLEGSMSSLGSDKQQGQ
jgi:hypothetical protein